MEHINKVGKFTRLIGWLITAAAGFGVYFIADYLERSELPFFIVAALGGSLGIASWVALLVLNDRFDLMGDHKE